MIIIKLTATLGSIRKFDNDCDVIFTFKVTQYSFENNCEISQIDTNFPEDGAIAARCTVLCENL